MSPSQANLEELRTAGIADIAAGLTQHEYSASSTFDLVHDNPVLFERPLESAMVALSVVSWVDAGRRGGSAVMLSPYVGWRDPKIETVVARAHSHLGQPNPRWASITAPLPGIAPDGLLNVAPLWEVRNTEGMDARVANLLSLVDIAVPSWLSNFDTTDGVLAYAKQWGVLGDVTAQESGLTLACLNHRSDDVSYFGEFIFRRTARAMLRHGEYDMYADRYRAIGAVTGTAVPVPDIEQVTQWAEQKAR